LFIDVGSMIDAKLSWRSMKDYLYDYIKNNKSKIFDNTINEFKKQIPLSIEKTQDYIIGTVFTTLNENIENDYACFWEISKQSNILSQEKDKFIMYINEIISKLNFIQENLDDQLLKEKENDEKKRKGKNRL